jgi:hypothetical protein
MADLFNVTAPLMIRMPSGEQHLMAERFPLPSGLLYFEPFWHLGNPDVHIHRVEGPIKGEGPWKVGDHVVHVLGCHGTDFCLASDFDAWRQYLLENAEQYPPRALIEAIARRHGASTGL